MKLSNSNSTNNSEKRILVTGASKGIGQAIAVMLGKQGYHVVCHFNKDEAGAIKTQSLIERDSSLIQFDIANREQCRTSLEQEMEKNGHFYGVVSNAGITNDNAFPAMLEEEWDSVINTNLGSFYNVIKPCLMPMIRARTGRIVVMSSVSGIAGNRGQANYAAAKAGLIGAAKSLAIELAKRNITVNCVAPGLIDTGMISDEIYQHAKEFIPMQRMGSPQEVASLVKYLMSDDAAYITRQVISINGGMV